MLLKCLECNYKYGNIAVLKYHCESCHKDKIDKCMCGNIILSSTCANNFSSRWLYAAEVPIYTLLQFTFEFFHLIVNL